MNQPIHRRAGFAVTLSALVLLAGCGGETGETEPAASPPATTAAAPTSESTDAAADPDEQAVRTAWSTVFDSSVPVADKLEHLAEPDLAEPVLAAYATAGEQVGGISLEPTAVAIDGETAEVTYDVLFGGTAAYSDQTGTVERSGDTWVVGTEQFCSFMASARTPCP